MIVKKQRSMMAEKKQCPETANPCEHGCTGDRCDLRPNSRSYFEKDESREATPGKRRLDG